MDIRYLENGLCFPVNKNTIVKISSKDRYNDIQVPVHWLEANTWLIPGFTMLLMKSALGPLSILLFGMSNLANARPLRDDYDNWKSSIHSTQADLSPLAVFEKGIKYTKIRLAGTRPDQLNLLSVMAA